MNLSRRWLEDYIDLNGIDDHELMSRLTMSTAEVEEVQRMGEHFNHIVTARITAMGQHPNADKLRLATVEYGADDPLEVICGAPNIEVGQIVPLATVGCPMPAGELKKAKIRGVESIGMLCSEREMGLSDAHTGIMVLPEDTPVGIPLKDVVGFTDAIIDIDNKSLTHRPDLWGHVGFCRELAAIYDRPYTYTPDTALAEKLYDESKKDALRIENQAADVCPRYCALVVENVSVKPSPRWMQERLIAVGLRPINNLVDITNFVQYELGQPMHAFDRRQIAGDIIRVRMAQQDEAFSTLDEREHKLCSEDIVIADADRAVALGGVMGGLNSEIQEDTTALVFESACFDAATIRRTAQRHDCRTDSSMRFEKSQDPENADTGIFRALELLLETCPDAVVTSELLDSYPGKADSVSISITLDFLKRRLGIDISAEDVTRILTALEFGVEYNDSSFTIAVPSFRATKDIGIPYDIVEEIGRIWGYDNITPAPPAIDLRPPKERNEFRTFEWVTRDYFALELGFTEVMNYSFVGEDQLKRSGEEPGKELMLRNALASHHDRMRRNLVPGLLEHVTGNLRFFHDFSLFEVGRAYIKEDRQSPKLAEEHTLLAAAMVNAGEDDFYRMKGAIERYLKRMGINGASFEPAGGDLPGWAHPGQAAVIMVQRKPMGHLATLHPKVARNFDIVRHRVILCEMDIGGLFALPARTLKFKQWSEQPTSPFELSVLADRHVYVRDIEKLIRKAAGKQLMDIRLFSVYEGASVPEGQKSVSYHLVFGESERTLSSDEINDLRQRVIDALQKAGYPLKQ